MKFKTAYNHSVQSFMTTNKVKNSKKLKYQLFNEFKDRLEKGGRAYEELFPRVKTKVVEYIFFLTATSGIWKIGADVLAEKLGCSISSVYNTVMILKKTDTFVIARLANNGAGKYVFVSKLHPNFHKIMKEVFELSSEEIIALTPTIEINNSEEKIDIKGQFKGLENSLKPDTAGADSSFSPSYLFKSFLKQENKVILESTDKISIKKAIDNERPKSFSAQRETLIEFGANTYQMTLFELILEMPYAQDLKDQAYKIALRAGSDLDSTTFYKAKDAVNELAMRICNKEMDIRTFPALFEAIFKAYLAENKISDLKILEIKTGERKVVPFYNWLEE